MPGSAPGHAEKAPGREPVAVAISGGVDSLCALLLLKANGHEVLAIHGLFLKNEANDRLADDLSQTCRTLDIPLHIADFSREFEENVIRPFVEDYACGLTPNPCSRCNRLIKFDLLLQAAQNLGAGCMATGHYARIINVDGHCLPARGADLQKDQSYFLALAKAENLRRVMFPLGGMTKTQCRKIVAACGIAPPQSRESQDVCFVASGEYGDFIKDKCRKWGIRLKESGPIFLREEDGSLRHIGLHKGLWRYTAGQRRGLGIAWKEPLYAAGKNVEDNSLIVAPRKLALMRVCLASNANVFLPESQWPENLYVKTRYNMRPAAAFAEIDGTAMRVIFKDAQLPSACGQTVAVYAESGSLLAGGIVSGVEQAGLFRHSHPQARSMQ